VIIIALTNPNASQRKQLNDIKKVCEMQAVVELYDDQRLLYVGWDVEAEFEAFKLGAMIQDLRKEQGMTQEQLAEKCGTTKTYISRIENNASDIRLSTLMRIVRDGLGGTLKLNVTH
jgi:DNA-binding XRE family transcriptional regulator